MVERFPPLHFHRGDTEISVFHPAFLSLQANTAAGEFLVSELKRLLAIQEYGHVIAFCLDLDRMPAPPKAQSMLAGLFTPLPPWFRTCM